MADRIHGFDRSTLEAMLESFEGQPQTVNVGPAIEPGFDVHVESLAGAAARFIRAALADGVNETAHQPQPKE